MKKMTLDSIARDPWNAVEQNLPWFPSAKLLRAAYRAAWRCAMKEHALMIEALEKSSLLPPEYAWRREGEPGLYEYNQARCRQAVWRLREIEERRYQKFCVPLPDVE